MKSILLLIFISLFSFNLSAQFDWKNTYSYNLINFVNSIDTTSEHGYFIAGGYKDVSSLGNYFAAKLDSNGNEIWQILGTKYIGFANDNIARCIVNTGDGGCLIGGEINVTGSFDLYFIRINSTGQVVWERIWGGENSQRMSTIINNGNKYLCTFTTLVNPLTNYLLEFDDQGDSIWTKILTGNGPSSSIIKATNGNFIHLGAIKDSIDQNKIDLTISKLDSAGNTLSIHTFIDTISFYPRTINQSPDLGFLFSSYNDIYYTSKITKVDINNQIQWERTFSPTNWCASTIHSNNDLTIVTGKFNSSIYAINFDSSGNFKGGDTIPIGVLKSKVNDNITDWNGDLLICGNIYDSNSCMTCSTEGIVVKVGLNTINKITELSSQNSVINIFPNPINSSVFDLTIKTYFPVDAIKLFDINGKIIFQNKIYSSSLNSVFHIQLSKKLNPGTYFIYFENKSKIVEYKKLIVFN